MAKDIIMQVLTSAGYEPMYPFNPAQILNATVASSSTATQYNLTITGIPTPITNAIGNKIGLISFLPNAEVVNILFSSLFHILVIMYYKDEEFSN